jgi:DNA replicative helicase MCM subunit Mcm2 (Cdc46/Mcm family)
MEQKVPKRLTDWVSQQVDGFEETTTSLELAFLSTISAEECEGSGFVIKVSISPMSLKKESKGKGNKNPTDEAPSDSVIIEFLLSDGKHSIPCAIHNAPDATLPGGQIDNDAIKEALAAITTSQREGNKVLITGQFRNYKSKRLFIVDNLILDANNKKSKLVGKQIKTFLSKCSAANMSPLDIMCDVLWVKFFAPNYIKKALMLFSLNPLHKHEMIHVGLITSHGEGKDTLIEKVIQPLVPCGVASSGQMTTIPGMFGAMSSDDLSSVDVGLMPKMNHERIAISEFQLWKDTVFGELLGAMANGYVKLTKGKLDISKPTCLNILMLGNPPHHFEDGDEKRDMMEAFGRYTPQIVSRLTLIFTQLKLNPDDKTAEVEEIIVRNMEEGNKNKKANDELIMWQQFFKEYLRYMSHQDIPLMDSYGLIKSVYDSLKAKTEFQEIFHSRGMADNRKWAEFVNLCRAFSRIHGHIEVTNEDIHEAYTLMLESLRTLTQHFDIHDLGLDLSPMLQTIYREIKSLGAADSQTLSKIIKLKVHTVNNCLETLKEKKFIQQIGDTWVICKDEEPTGAHYVKNKVKNNAIVEVQEVPKDTEPPMIVSDEISNELLEELERHMNNGESD